MGAPVNTGLGSRIGNWCSSWTPSAYDAENRKYLSELNPSGDFIRLIEGLSDALPNVTTSQVTSIGYGIGWAASRVVGGKEKEIQRGIFLHIAAHFSKLYLKDKKNLSQEEILSAIAIGLSDTIRKETQNPLVSSSRYYTVASEMLPPVLRNLHPIVKFLASALKDIHDTSHVSLDYDPNDKLVGSLLSLNTKIIDWMRKEVVLFPADQVANDYQPLFKTFAPLIANHPSFDYIWTNLKARLPAIAGMTLVHLRTLLSVKEDAELIEKLKADFKQIYRAAGPLNEKNAKELASTLLMRYLKPVFHSSHIPEFMRAFVMSKLAETVSSKLLLYKDNLDEFLSEQIAKPNAPALNRLPVIEAAPVEIAPEPLAHAPAWYERYTPDAIAKSYKNDNEQYLFNLVNSDSLIRLVKNLSHQIDFSKNAPLFLKTMVNGSAKELQEGIFIHLVVSVCKTIYKDKPNPESERQVASDIFRFLTSSIKNTFDKADLTRNLKIEDFNEAANLLIKNFVPELGDVPYAIDPVAKLLYEFYLVSRVPIAPVVKDPLSDTIANLNQKAVNFVKKEASDVKNSDVLKEIDPGLGAILELLIKQFSDDPLFAGVRAFFGNQIASLLQSEVAYLKTIYPSESNRELAIKLCLDFSRIWKENRKEPEALTHALLNRYFTHIIDSNLIPATFKPLIVSMIQEKLKAILLKHQANIDAFVQAFDLENEILLNDPLRPFAKEARQMVSALTKRYYPNVLSNLPKSLSETLTKELGESFMEDALYHVFGRLQKKFQANNFKELESRLIAFTHQKLSVLIRSAEFDDKIYLRLAEELLDEAAPGINAVSLSVKAHFAGYLKTIAEIVHVREPKNLGFGELDKEIKPFLYSLVDLILQKSLEKPIEIIPELVLRPEDLNNPDTLKLARETLYRHLAAGFAEFFGNGKLHQGLHTLLLFFSDFGKDKAQVSEDFAKWAARFNFDPKKEPSLSEEEGSKAFNKLLKKVPFAKRSYLNDLLMRRFDGDVEKKKLFCRHLLLDLNVDDALKELAPLLDTLEKMDRDMGSALMRSFLPALSRDKYPGLFDNAVDLFAPSLLRLLGTIPEKLSLHCERDLKSLETPQIHPAATMLSKLSALTDAISESALESDIAIGKKLAAFFVEIGASHMIANNDHDIDLLIVWLAERNFLTYDDAKLKKFAKKLIKAFCPVLEAFSPSSEEMVVKLLQAAKAKIPSNDRKEAKASIREILFDPENKTDHHHYDVNRYIEQIDTAVYAFAGLILKWTRAYGENNLPDSLKQLVKVEGPLLKHSQEVIAALLMKALLNFIRKVEEVNPGPKGTLLGRAVYVLIQTIVTNLPDIKEGNFKDLSEALWKLFDLDKETSFDLSFVRNEFLPKQLMEYSHSMRKYIEEMPKNSKELKELFSSNALPELLRVLGTVWIKDFAPHFLSENTDELSGVLLSEINSFFDVAVLQEGDSVFIADTIRELLKKREDNAMDSAYAFIGLYASAFMMKFFNNLFKKNKIDTIAQDVARGAISRLSTYYSKVVEVKGRRPHAHLLNPEELKEGLGNLFSDGMPIQGDELSDRQKAFYINMTKALEKAGGVENAESMPMIDFLQEPVHNLITDKLLPSTLNAIIKTVGSRKTINKGLLKFIETVTEKISLDGDVLENAYHNTLCHIDDLNYRLNGIKEVSELKELVKEIKAKYGAVPDKVMEILKFVDEKSKSENGATLDKLKSDVLLMTEPLKKLAESQDEALIDDLSKLRDAIIHLVPKKFVADLLKIEAFNEMTSSQLGVLYSKLVNGLKFEDLVNMGAEVLMPVLIPNGAYDKDRGHFGPLKFDVPLAADFKDIPYTEAEAKADEKRIISGFAEVSIDGTNKAFIHGIKTYIRELSMKIGQKLIKWFGVRVIPLRKAYTAIAQTISYILTPVLYVISHLSSPVIKFVERKVARREIEPHIRGFHADYNQNMILLLMEDLVALLTNGKLNDKENLQNSNARV